MCKSNENLRCADCANFLGIGDWNLCCKNPPEDQVGWCGFLCYEDTEACKNFKPIASEFLEIHADWTPCIQCYFFEDCETKESRDGCYLGEPKEIK